MPGAALSEVTAEWFAAGSPPPQEPPWVPPLAVPLPAYCRLSATLDRRTGADGRSYGIGFALALPAEWNGRFLFQGGGGLNGTVAPPLGRTGQGDAALARGFAVVTTDTGHRGEVFDASFMAEQQASLDFAYQAVGRVAVLAKQILAQHYGRPAAHAYFMGCSTGGREGMLMAQRYPDLLRRHRRRRAGDAHALLRDRRRVGRDDAEPGGAARRVGQAGRAPRVLGRRSEDGDRRPARRLRRAPTACATASSPTRSGAASIPRRCVCAGEKTDGCLSRAQAEALARAFAGPKDSKGRPVYPGFLFDTGIAATQGIPGLLAGSANPVGPPFTATEMDVDKRAEDAAADPQVQLTSTSGWTNLNTFSSRGGKLLFFHGVSDPWFSALDTVDYYERMARANGGASVVTGWSRLFLVPGMGHCGGGPATLDTFDMLGAVVDWVENQKAPQAIRATGRSWPGRSRPLCPYPSHAHYKGTGDVEDAASFECR